MRFILVFFLLTQHLFANDLIFRRHGAFFDVKFAKYLKKGGKKEDIVEIANKEDLLKHIRKEGLPISPNTKGTEHRFNYIFDEENKLRISRYQKGTVKEVAQDILTLGKAIYAAGEIYIFKDGKELRVWTNNHSRKYCTPFKNLNMVSDFLKKIRVDYVGEIEYPSKFCITRE